MAAAQDDHEEYKLTNKIYYSSLPRQKSSVTKIIEKSAL
jgi:hypothetical protein